MPPIAELLMLMPLRSSRNAVLQGFELRRRDSVPEGEARSVWAQTRPPAVEDIRNLLDSGLARLLASLSLRLWLPMPACRGAEQLQRVLVNSPVPMADIVLVLDGSDPQWPARLGQAVQVGCRVAIPEPRDASDAAAGLAQHEAVQEVRCTISTMPPDAGPPWRHLARTVLDVGTPGECERAIAAGCESLQGEFVGGARSAAEVAARIESGYSTIESVL